MKQNPIFYILLAILIVQPLLVIGFGPTMATTAIQPADTIVPSQGTRLAPGAHTDHVPVLIYDNADFTIQGWPGAGTPGDPYIISGLNITYDIGVVAIQVHNVDASFVIRDCFINQLSSEPGIEFINTTDGIVEHTTVISKGTGITFDNANSTQIMSSHILVDGTSYYSIIASNSLSCHLEDNIFNSTEYRCADFTNCHDLVSRNNIYFSSSGWLHTTFNSCNFTSITGDSFINGYIGIRFFTSHGATLEGITIDRMDRGVYVQNSPDFSITDSIMDIELQYGVYVLNSDNTVISGCTMDGPGNPNGLIYTTGSKWLTITGNTLSNSDYHGILVSGAHNSTISSNTITDCSPNGILVGDSHDCEVSSNTVTGSSSHGIEVSTSHRIVMDGNDVSDIGDKGIFIEYSDNGTLSNTVVNGVSNEGIELDDCDNWQVNDNTVTNAGVGIYLYLGVFTDVWSNDVSDIINEGIAADTHGMLETWENTVTNAGVGFYYTTCDNLYVRYETATGCADGFHVDTSVESEFSENVISDCTNKGFNLWDVANTTFIHNTLTNCEPYGFYLEFTANLTFTDNILTEGGFFAPSTPLLSEVNHTLSGNTVNGLPVYYRVSAEDLTINGANYGQILLVNCSDVDITGGVFSKTSIAILLHTCEDVTITGVQISDQVNGIVVVDSENITVQDSDVNTGLLGLSWGITVMNTALFNLLNVEMSMIASGLYLAISDNATIDNCHFQYFDGYAIHAADSFNGTLINSEMFQAEAGILLENSLNWSIIGNHMYWCEYGIETNYADFMVLALNDIHDCFVGVYYYNTYTCVVYNNTIRWNYGGFIQESCSDGSWMYFNVFALNFWDNGYDADYNGWNSTIDDATGNYWGDYNGTGTYSVNGPGGAIDYYPMQYIVTEPIISTAFDASYAEGTTGHEADWSAYDDYLSYYTVTVDGEHWITEVVPDLYKPAIEVNIDGLAYGEHTMVITVWDINMNSVSDTILIDVYDDIDPTIDNPPNIEIFFDIDGNEIVWEVVDLNPDNYVLSMDGSEYETGSWTSGTITLSLDGLSAGQHDFTMVVYDADENSASDSVSILVINDDTGPAIDSPDDIMFVVETTGNRIIWTPTDVYPDSYEITFNNTVVAADSWGGGRIVLELDYLEVGHFNFTLTVWDGGRASASDIVSVQVIPYEGWTPELPPPDFTLLIIAGVGITGAIVVIGLIYFFKVKKPKAGGA